MLILGLRNNEAFEAIVRLCPTDGASALSLNSPTSKPEERIDSDDPRWIENDSNVTWESG